MDTRTEIERLAEEFESCRKELTGRLPDRSGDGDF